MEEKNNMTAERSLEIITEQIERSRQVVAKDTGLSLYVAGLCTMGMALLIGILIYLTSNTAWYLMYVLLPLVIFAADRYADVFAERFDNSVELFDHNDFIHF